ncbi:flagellar basal-body rod protein FlgF [Egicoccus halophilus]|uniref:Flagellar basal-body rod protein FlgG n=1 Tax=Egicoccus halophilus TaxID=1670830 RepID=A0A8J3EU10_9ACTN|nr:flagellar basal-body rod protein FlgF [Egicoccus halophilus]GGI06705.1 flagellar basal-body rod protein FlgG [Egicoccus halophilus]
MLRSMFSAVSGLRSHQTMMDVTGNNVANVNTAGYKAVRTTFQETLTQVVRGGTAGGGNQGGTNPMQLGLGSAVAATDLVFSQGASQVTGRATDVAIQGDGFFVVQDNAGTNFYTRAGAFGVDSAGNMVTPDGLRVVGVNGPINVQNATDVSVGSDGTINGRVNGQNQVLGQIQLARFPNPGGLTRVGNGLFDAGDAAGAVVLGAPGDAAQGLGGLQSGTLEMSNVDLAAEFTNLILAQRGFQANARTISTSDELLQELVNLKR